MTAVDLVKNWLAEEGFKGFFDEDGDLQFKYQGFNFLVTRDNDDPLFLRVIMPKIYEIDIDLMEVYKALNDINAGYKAVKGYIVGNYVWLSIEMYVDSSPEIVDFFERCLDILIVASKKFYENIQQQ